MTESDDALMWEVRATPGTRQRLLDWIDQQVLAFLGEQRNVYQSTEDRVVVIARFDGAPISLPEPPE